MTILSGLLLKVPYSLIIQYPSQPPADLIAGLLEEDIP